MKRIILVLSLLLSVLLLLPSCSKDDNGSDDQSGITGIWKSTLDGATVYMRLATNGDVTLYTFREETDEDEAFSRIDVGTYSVQNNKIHFTTNHFTEEITYTLGDDGVLAIIDNNFRWSFTRATSQEAATYLSDLKDVSSSALLGAWRSTNADGETEYLYFSADGNCSDIVLEKGESASVEDFQWTLCRNALILMTKDDNGIDKEFMNLFVDAVSKTKLTLKALGQPITLTKVDDSEVEPYLKSNLTPASSKRKPFGRK